MIKDIPLTVLNWRPYPVNASLEYRRLWTWLEFRLKGRPRATILAVIHAMIQINRVYAEHPQRVNIGDFAHVLVEKPFQRFELTELAETTITQLVDNGKLERNTDFGRFPVTVREVETYAHVIVLQLDGITRDAYTIRIPVEQFVFMLRLLLDVAHDDYGLVIEDLVAA